MESGVTGDDPVFKQALAREFKVEPSELLRAELMCAIGPSRDSAVQEFFEGML